MRRWQPVLAAAGMFAVLWIAAPSHAATFNSGSNNANDPFPTCTPTPCTVTIALPASGVLQYSTITILSGVTVQFTRNATNTPVTLLASGEVTIAGTINLDGQPGAAGSSSTSFANAGGAGGPGGFGGGAGSNATVTVRGGAGLGPGGGGTPTVATQGGGGGGFGTAGGSFTVTGAGGPAYGNPQLLPLLGGSGGGGASASLGATGGAGGGGGGALLLASSTTVTLTGTITAKGGAGGAGDLSGNAGFRGGGGGGGGGVRLVATTLAGTGGAITATGATAGATAGGAGRIRLEAFTNTLSANVSGVAPSTGQPGVVFPAGLPSLSITSVANLAAPAAPTGSYATPDITLPSNTLSPVAVVVTATAVPGGTAVVLRGKPQTGTATTATTPGLSGGTASANLALDLTQPNVISAEATFQVAAIDVPVKVAEAAGPADPVTHARVSAAFGGASQVAYITRAGREISP